ncbi:MAG: NAD-dependent epimerase/dehydratase family protein [Porticoccaceae bacterium]|nr:NAD-dependent epimerase/dehydratase family protein [Porticoccaceae bacterium]MDG1473851.1 NAD-dependent epimerase/dehydratase family protein [Porticoccaceae bacterium]
MSEKIIKKILITGANGFIGNALMRYYQNNNQAVVGVDLVGNGSDIIKGDVANPETIADLLAQCDVIVHTAALVSNAMADNDMWQVNVLATSNLIAAAKKYKVRRFVQISSIVVYGNDAEGELDENQPVHANGGSYVLTKLASEHAVLAAQANSDIEVVIVRPGDAYGPGSRPWIIAPLEAIAKKQFMLPAKGQGFFRPIYIDDLVRGIALATEHSAATGEIFNLSCEGYISTKDYFTPHYQWMGKKGPLLVSTKLALRVAAITSIVANLMGNLNEASPATVAQLATKSWFSIKKAEHILGWKPEISFDEGMQRSKKWASDNGLLDK